MYHVGLNCMERITRTFIKWMVKNVAGESSNDRRMILELHGNDHSVPSLIGC